MDFNEYQKAALATATYPNFGHNTLYPAMGLGGESGEALDKVKKWWRNYNATQGNDYTDEQRIELAKELGDCLWYLAALSYELETTLEDIAVLNLEKLTSRRDRGVIKSEGDNR
jgi:NTP pyrophosphatase (non-canonical NTP hydrolase)